jgi:hypothetical protein
MRCASIGQDKRQRRGVSIEFAWSSPSAGSPWQARDPAAVTLTGAGDGRSPCSEALFDDLIGTGEECRWKVEAEHLRGVHIDHEFELD